MPSLTELIERSPTIAAGDRAVHFGGLCNALASVRDRGECLAAIERIATATATWSVLDRRAPPFLIHKLVGGAVPPLPTGRSA